MSPRGQVDIQWPLSSFPGSTPQESAGRLINCHSEPLGENGPSRAAWHRSPGLSQHAATTNAGYRGGLLVGTLSYETWSGTAVTVDTSGNVVVLGTLPGTKRVTIARNQAASPNVVAVDLDNGAFTLSGGPPASYNGGGNLPQPNSVCFQDSYFLFTIADGRIFASGNNALTQNSQTFTTCQAKSSVTLLRGIAYSGLLFAFTTASAEVYQDTANATPAFPYTRLVVLEYGLIQSTAIAGWEDGFSMLAWVAQDYGVYLMPPGSLAPTKVSPPDLDRLIEAQVKAGNTLEAGCYIMQGKKFWTISSPSWTWEFNLSTQRWNERWSLNTSGMQGRWRAVGGHPAFGKWLVGDTQGGTLAYVDDTVLTELGSPQLRRIESCPVANFPNRIRVARADFNFSTGAGIATGAAPNIVNPSVAVSWSDDDGINWKNPILRSLGLQGKSLRTRISVKNTGLSGPQARRWRLDDSDCVAPFVGATQSDDPREN
jgi:hypothetical protein